MRWEYHVVNVWYGEATFATGQQGIVGGAKKEKRKGWWVTFDDGHQSEREFLERMGDDGWELIGVVVSGAYSAGGSLDKWYEPSHRLFFKRAMP